MARAIAAATGIDPEKHDAALGVARSDIAGEHGVRIVGVPQRLYLSSRAPKMIGA